MRGALFAGVAALCLIAQPAHAWKPKTHIYLAEEALRDALDNGKVTIRETDHANGRIVGVLGEFDVDPKILAALKAAPANYRAGVLGPDAYPDILTGQQVIHPDEALAHGGSASGSDAWLTHLWDRGFVNGASPQVQAFTVGYLTHAAGDIFAHTYVNYFAGGEFLLIPDPTNAVKHLVLEGYIGKRTPETISAVTTRVRTGGGPLNGRKRDDLDIEPGDRPTYENVNLPVTQANASIAGVEAFIYEEMTYARPGSVLEQKLLQGSATSRSIPFVFSALRNGLQKQVDEYERVRMSKTGPDRLAYAVANGPLAEYKKAWIKDIDAGLAALPAVSHRVATAIVYNEQGSNMDAAEAAMQQYVVDHMASMAGVPDGLVATAVVIKQIIDAISLPFLSDAIDALLKEPIDALVKGTTGRTAEEWKGYLKNPETHFDEVLNRPGGGHGGEVEHPIDLKTFNRDHLKIADDGYANPSLKWKIDELPPAFNTVQLTKMLMLGDAGMAQLEAALKAKGAAIGAPPGAARNHMLGWVRSMDAGNQWQGLAGAKPGPSPLPGFSTNGGAAYRKLFLAQTGEKPIGGGAPQAPPKPEHGSSPVPGGDQSPPAETPAPDLQSLRPWVDTWETSFGKVKLELGTDGVLRGRLMVAAEGGREREGERLELRAGEQPGTLTGTAAYTTSLVQVTLSLSPDQETFAATALTAGASKPTAWSGKRAKAVYRPPGGQATGSAPPGSSSGTVPPPAPRPPQTPAAFQALNNFEVRLDRTQAEGVVLWVHVTFKNISQKDQWMTSGIVRVLMEDSDGVVQERNQFWRPQGSPPTVFASTPLLAPGSELRARFRFNPDNGARPTSVVLREGETSARFPVRGF